jgi:hypothetical protein
LQDRYEIELAAALRAAHDDDKQRVYWHARRAISLRPGDSRSYAVASEVFDPSDGLWFLGIATQIEPLQEVFWTRHVRYSQWLGLWAEALDSARRAMILSPESLPACLNLAALLRDIGALQRSRVFFFRATYIAPNDEETAVAAASVLMALSQFSEAAPLFARRLGRPLNTTPQLASTKEPVFRGEQGLGDQILQLHSLRLANCTPTGAVLIDSRLGELARRSFPGVPFAPLDPLKPWDATVEVGLADFLVQHAAQLLKECVGKKDGPLFRADSLATELNCRRFRKLGAPVVGISLISTNPAFGHLKTVRPRDLTALFDSISGCFINLGHAAFTDLDESEARLWSRVTATPTDPLRDIDGLAAVISACDYVVCISGTVGHLAGALGVPTCVLVPFGAGRLWYWENRFGRQSAWYPSVQLFDQDASGSWEAAIRGIIAYVRSAQAKSCSSGNLDAAVRLTYPSPPV